MQFAIKSGIHGHRLTAVLLAVVIAGCEKPAPPAAGIASGPLAHSAYVWQRDWTDAVRSAVSEHGRDFRLLAVLGAQAGLESGRVRVVRPAVNWKALASSGAAVAAVVRMEKPLPPDPEAVVLEEATRLRTEAAAAGVALTEIQVDYDAPQKKLAPYRLWLKRVERALEPLPVRITTLASWLPEPEFIGLIHACDGYVLQVHSFDPPAAGQEPAVCDPAKARAWVAQAAKLGRPFTVALPTYRTTAGFDAGGKFLGVATDAMAPQWPPGTIVREYPAPAADLAALIREWTQHRPALLDGIIWYRLPVASDTRNWRWPALAAVMSGQVPASQLEVKFAGAAPLDVVLSNTGELDEWLPQSITLTWPGPAPAAGDGLAEWTLTTDSGRAVFSRHQPVPRLLPAGKSAALGWLRFYEPAPNPDTIRSRLDPPPASSPGDR